MGNRRLRAPEILSHVKMKLGSPYSERQVQRDYQAILKLGWFDKVETRVSIEDGLRGGVVVIFEVRELPLILEVKFAGLDTVPEAVVMKAMRRARINLARDAVYDATQVRRAAKIIQRVLALHGRPNATVKISNEFVTSQSVRLTFVISD
jgi:outer membrane protein assembly factor BamA